MNRLVLALAATLVLSAGARAETLQYAIPFNEHNDFTKIAVQWADDVKKATNGEVVFKPVLNGALVPLPETLDAVGDGVVPAAMAVASFMSGAVPAFGYVEMMGGLPLDKPSTGEALAKIWPGVDTALEAKHVRALWGSPAFATGVICRQGFLKGSADWKGKKIRTAGRWQAKQVEVMGATPVPLPPSEIYVALQNGVVDCALMVPPIVLAAHLYEVAPYYTLLDFVANISMTIISADTWSHLSAKQQATVKKISDEATQNSTVSLRKLAKEQMEVLAQKGKVYAATAKERAELIEKSKPIFAEVAAAAGKGKPITDILAGYQ